MEDTQINKHLTSIIMIIKVEEECQVYLMVLNN